MRLHAEKARDPAVSSEMLEFRRQRQVRQAVGVVREELTLTGEVRLDRAEALPNGRVDPRIDERDTPIAHVALQELEPPTALAQDEVIRDALVVIAEVVLDGVSAVAEAEDEVLVPKVSVVLHHVPEDRAIADRHHRLRNVLVVVPKPHPQTTAEQDDLHLAPLPLEGPGPVAASQCKPCAHGAAPDNSLIHKAFWMAAEAKPQAREELHCGAHTTPPRAFDGLRLDAPTLARCGAPASGSLAPWPQPDFRERRGSISRGRRGRPSGPRLAQDDGDMGRQSVAALTAHEPAADIRTLDRSLVQGIAWTSGAKWAGQLLGWASTLIVARLLTPADYGLVGMAAIYLGLITVLSEFGLGTAVLAVRELSVEQLNQLNGLAVLLGLASLLASCIVAIPLGRFFHAPQLPLVVVAMSTTFVITSFKTVPLALLQRDLRFKTLAFIDLSQALVLAISMVGFAVAGFRYWTLVCGGVLSALISTGAILRLRRAPLAWPRRTSLKPAITLSSNVLISRLCWYASSNADFLVAGRILGKAALGFYNVGWTLANVPVDKVTALVGQVTPAVLSTVQTDPAALRRYLLRITEGIALITFPLGLGLALVAQDFVLVVLGSKWSATIAPLRLLAAYAAFRSIIPLLPTVLHTIRDTRFEMWNMVAAAVVMPTSFYLCGQRWGTVGLAVAWVLVDPLFAFM